jgi:DNA-binding transcriptional ArsR family regulator
MSSSKIKEYASLRYGIWGSGEFGNIPGRPDPYTVLSDETRLAITVLLCLKGPLTAKQMADELGLSPSTVLDHINKLKEAMVIKEVEVPEKKYKREKYYDVDIVPYFIDEREEIRKKISKYADILKQTTLAVFEKCLSEVSELLKDSLMAKHGMTVERDDVKFFIFSELMEIIHNYLSERGMLKSSLQTTRRYYLYLPLQRVDAQECKKNSAK